MARKNIELGVIPSGQGGDTFRSAMIKVNDMTEELYGIVGGTGGSLATKEELNEVKQIVASVDGKVDTSAAASAEQIAKREHTLIAGKNITIDRTNPAAPVVSAKGGEHGVGSATAPLATDCNAINIGGIYNTTPDTLNAPSAGSFTLLHEPYGEAGAFTQIAIGNGPGSAIWCRSNNGQWGRILKTGDYGLGSVEAPYVADASAVAQAGFFRTNEVTENIPVPAPGTLICHSVLSGNFTQVFTPARGHPSGESMWFRVWGGGTPSAWRELCKVGDFGLGSKDISPDVSANAATETRFYRSYKDANSANLGLTVGIHMQRDTARSGEISLNWLDESLQYRISNTMVERNSWVKVAKDAELVALRNRVAELEKTPAKPIPSWVSTQTLNTSIAVVNGVVWTACGTSASMNNSGVGRGGNGVTRLFGVSNYSMPPFFASSKVKKVAGNGLNNLFLMESGALLATGWNNNGQAGLGHLNQVLTPTFTAAGILDVYYEPSCYSINADASKSVARTADGIVVCGYNAYGQLGTGDTNVRNTWVKVWHDGQTKDPNVAAWGEIDKVWNLGAAFGCMFVRTKDNRLFACGYNANGQLGTGDLVNKLSFTDVTANWGGPTEVASIVKMLGGYGWNDAGSNGGGCTYAQLPDGYRFSGYNGYGQGGNNTVVQVSTPIKVSMTEAAKEFYVQGGGVTSCLWVGVSGRLWVWGRNAEYALGTGNNTQLNVPTLHPWYNGTALDRTVDEILNKGGFVRQGYSYACMTFLRAMDGAVHHFGLSGSYESGANSNQASISPRRVFLPLHDSNGNIAKYTHVTILDTTWTAGGGCSIHCYNSIGDCYVWGANAYYGCSVGLDGADIPVPVKVRPGWA